MTRRSLRSRVRRRLTGLERRVVLGQVKSVPDLGLEKIGSGYGGWIVPTTRLGADWICYCGGVGEDITFDLGIIERFGCSVVAFDPTPRAIAYVAEHAADEPRFTFRPVGLWTEDTSLRFFAPRDPSHVSHSAVNLQRTETYFEAEVRTLPTLMRDLGHDRIDLLKLDIEGAEHGVTRSFLAAGIRPTVYCLEIDQPVRPWTFWRTVRRIRSAGYTLVAVDGWNLTFMRTTAIEPPALAAAVS